MHTIYLLKVVHQNMKICHLLTLNSCETGGGQGDTPPQNVERFECLAEKQKSAI